MFKVVITRAIPEMGINLLKKKGYNVRISPHDRPLTAQKLKKFIHGADAILCLLTDRITEDVIIAAGSPLKIIANFAVGFDNIDISALKKYGIIATNTPVPEMTESVAEHTCALMLALSRRIVEADHYTRKGKYHGWSPSLFLGNDLHGATLGIIGMGRIGLAVAQRAVTGFGMKLLYTSPHVSEEANTQFHGSRVNLRTLLKKADVISLHVPLIPATRHLISAKELQLMKKTALLINTSRGPIVDEKALTNALTKGQITGAALDVFECEPRIDCDPFDTLELKKLSNVILTPHIASATVATRNAMAVAAAKNIIAVLSGAPALNPLSLH